MHSILALAASDLLSPAHSSLARPPDLLSTAISHRLKAIVSLNEALSTESLSFSQGNAMLGTCYALVFQSTLMDDGLPEYMTFIRGIVLVSIQLKVRNLNFMFGNMLDEESLAAMEPMLEKAPEIENGLARAACESLNQFLPLCQREPEKSFHSLLFDIASGLLVSSRLGKFQNVAKIYF